MDLPRRFIQIESFSKWCLLTGCFYSGRVVKVGLCSFQVYWKSRVTEAGVVTGRAAGEEENWEGRWQVELYLPSADLPHKHPQWLGLGQEPGTASSSSTCWQGPKYLRHHCCLRASALAGSLQPEGKVKEAHPLGRVPTHCLGVCYWAPTESLVSCFSKPWKHTFSKWSHIRTSFIFQ